MFKYTFPNGVVIEYPTLAELVSACKRFNIPFTPTQALIDADARKSNALADAKLATELRSLTPAQAVAYIEANVTTLATAKAALKVLTRLVVALCNETWPTLPEE